MRCIPAETENDVCRKTTIVCAVEEGAICIGLHTFQLDIDEVYVGGQLCDHHTSRWWDEVLRYSGQYKACLLREVQPELIITVRISYSHVFSCDRCS